VVNSARCGHSAPALKLGRVEGVGKYLDRIIIILELTANKTQGMMVIIEISVVDPCRQA